MAIETKRSLVILGGGIGGTRAYHLLAKKLRKTDISITLIDREALSYYTPLFYKVGTEHVPLDVAGAPFHDIVTAPHTFLQADILAVNPEKKIITTSGGDVSYDWCIVALGSGVEYYGTPGAKEYTYTVRSPLSAVRLSEKIKEIEDDAKKGIGRSISIIGGGFTGIEIAGELASALRLWERRGTAGCPTITVFTTGDRVAEMLPPRVSKQVANHLTRLGVTLRYQTRVTQVTPTSLFLGTEEVASDCTVWCAGVASTAASFFGSTPSTKGCLMVDDHLRVGGSDTLFAIGDCAFSCDPDRKTVYPQLGEAAWAGGAYVAHIIARTTKGKKTKKPFRFHSKGTLLPVSHTWGIATFLNNKIILRGILPNIIKLAVHMWHMPTWKSKSLLLLVWLRGQMR